MKIWWWSLYEKLALDLRIWRWNFYERWSRQIICPVMGHRWTEKVSGHVCKRCRMWTPHGRGVE